MKIARIPAAIILAWLLLFSSGCLPATPPQVVTQAGPAQSISNGSNWSANWSTAIGFPSQLTFNLRTADTANITDVRLHYSVERESFADVTSEVYVDFTHNTIVDTSWTWDMRKTGGLPTGAKINYWWIVRDTAGEIHSTNQSTVNFDDTRYQWQRLTEQKVTIFWYKGGQSFAQNLMSAAQEAMTRLAQNTGATLKNPVKLYIYANTSDLQGAMIFPQDWTGGVAFTEFGTIAIGIDTTNLDWGKRAIAHELTHLVTHQMTFNPYNEMPTWLNEGLSMYNEGTLESQFTTVLNQAIDNNNLISVHSLSSPFSAFASESYLSYAESYSLVDFLINKYGQSKMLDLLTTFREGISYDNALQKVYGFDMDGLNELWRDYAVKQRQATRGG